MLKGDYLYVKGEKEEIDGKEHGTSSLGNCMYGFIINQDREYQHKIKA